MTNASQVFIIYNPETLKQLGQWNYTNKTYSSAGAAKSALTRMSKRPNFEKADWQITDLQNFNDNIDYEVETTNLLNPGSKVMIRKSQLGGCCDPGTERYHSM